MRGCDNASKEESHKRVGEKKKVLFLATKFTRVVNVNLMARVLGRLAMC